MNKLSWLLYLGNVAGNLGDFLIFMGIALTALAIGLVIWGGFLREDAISAVKYACHANYEGLKSDRNYQKLVKSRILTPGPIVLLVFAVLFWTSAVFCPSSDTVYAIAASEVGEQALATPLAGKAEQALEAWLDRQISPPPTSDHRQ